MFTPDRDQSKLSDSISELHTQLQSMDPKTEEYSTVLDSLLKMHKTQADTRRKSVSPDTLINASASILGIILILHYERLGIVTTKAIGFVPKPR